MKILHINYSDLSGGAAIAGYRLHCALRESGIHSRILVQNKTSDDPDVLCHNSLIYNIAKVINSRIESIPLKLYPHRKTNIFSTGLSYNNKIFNYINDYDPDIIHLHWINGGLINLHNLLTIKKPIVWSLHDMWPFTGGCHYDSECGRYINGCGFCPILNSNSENDLSQYIYNRKFKIYKKTSNLTFIGLSNWITHCARNTPLLSQHNIRHIPNLIDTNTFFPLKKTTTRIKLGLPIDKTILLIGAYNLKDDPRKGLSLLKSYFDMDIFNDNFHILSFGHTNHSKYFSPYRKISSTSLGNVKNQDLIRDLYSAADITIVPSLQENLSNMIMESMSCGTPVLCFNTGGNSDMVDHLVNGYLVKPFLVGDMVNGLEWCLSNLTKIKIASRDKILNQFSKEILIPRYLDLYYSVIK